MADIKQFREFYTPDPHQRIKGYISLLLISLCVFSAYYFSFQVAGWLIVIFGGGFVSLSEYHRVLREKSDASRYFEYLKQFDLETLKDFRNRPDNRLMTDKLLFDYLNTYYKGWSIECPQTHS